MPNGPSDVATGAPNPEDYTDNGDGTVSDNVTGLMWQQTPPSTSFNWTRAGDYCRTSTLVGYGDWRLPSRIELISILDVSFSAPAIDPTAFPGTQPGHYWSSTLLTRWSSSAWSVNFIVGYAGTDNSGSSASNYVRCVRAADVDVSPGGYVVVGGTVLDTKTKLTWQQTPPTATYAWPEAKTYCASVVTSALGGSGWRLPTYKELLTIVDNAESTSPMIDRSAFPDTPPDFFWSSTPGADSPSMAWAVEFNYGDSGVVPVTELIAVRCVR
jgi:hypothetical protein